MVREIWRNAVVTHGHPRAILGALLYGEALRTLATEQDLSGDLYVGRLRSFLRSIDPESADPDMAFWRQRWNEGGTRFEHLWPEFVDELDAMLRIALDGQRRDLRETYEPTRLL
jgi:hypothetical protein